MPFLGGTLGTQTPPLPLKSTGSLPSLCLTEQTCTVSRGHHEKAQMKGHESGHLGVEAKPHILEREISQMLMKRLVHTHRLTLDQPEIASPATYHRIHICKTRSVPGTAPKPFYNLFCSTIKMLGLVADDHNPSTCETEAKDLKFKVRLGYRARHCLRNQNDK